MLEMAVLMGSFDQSHTNKTLHMISASHLTTAEIAQAHALYTQGMKIDSIALTLQRQREHDGTPLSDVKAFTIKNLAHRQQWQHDRTEYMAKQSETIATALEALKATAGAEMVQIVTKVHNTFMADLSLLDAVRTQFAKAKPTSRELLDLMRASESLQKRLFAFHSLRSTPLASAAIPVQSIDAGSSAMAGGEAA